MEVPEKDYYTILDIERSATPLEIKEAYRKMAKKHHPDMKSTDEDHEPDLDKFRDVSEAYQILSVRESRLTYDLQRKKHPHKHTEHEAEYQANMEVQAGVRDKTGHMPRATPVKGSFEEDRLNELRREREKYNVNFMGYYNGGLPQKGLGRVRRSNRGKSLGEPGLPHSPSIHNFLENYTQEATFVNSEDAVQFKNWMRSDLTQHTMSRPHYKTYYDYSYAFLEDRKYFLLFLMGFWSACYLKYRFMIEGLRSHKDERRYHIEEQKPHHFTNRGGVLMKKEFIGFRKYHRNEKEQLEWLREAYPAIYTEEAPKQ